MIRSIAVTALLVVGAGCSSSIHPVWTSEAARIWVVQAPGGGDEVVLRCADGAAPTEVPKPVCVKAAVLGTGK